MRPAWLDTREYPFESKYLEVGAGRLHYIDEGQGIPIVMIHGNLAWSFLYRKVVKELSRHYRCIAVDLLGYGLSDKPEAWSYHPQEQADFVEQLLTQLQLKDIILMVHDLGAPIGFAYAMKHPANVKNIVLFNTWAWTLPRNPAANETGENSEGPLSRLIHAKLQDTNQSLTSELFRSEATLPEAIVKQYVYAQGDPDALVSTLASARTLPGIRTWRDELWQQRKVIKDIPTLILWGERDKLVKTEALQKWKDFFHVSYVINFEDSGHFLQEENAEEAACYIDNFIKEEKEKENPVAMPQDHARNI